MSISLKLPMLTKESICVEEVRRPRPSFRRLKWNLQRAEIPGSVFLSERYEKGRNQR